MHHPINLLAGISILSLIVASPAMAQSADEDTSAIARVLGAVTVTARKKADAENVQDVPIAVTAFNADTLDALNIRDLEGLSFSTPNVDLEDIGTARGTANFSIRGLGVNSSIPSIDPTVGVFVDGVYLGINNGVVFDLFDLDSVEVLRGPQGLLFGRNTTGGAVLVNTGNPTSDYSYSVKAAVETPVDSGRGGINSTVQGVISGPLVQDRLNGKIAAYYNTDEGYFKNQFNGDNQGEAQTTIVRGALEFFASENLTLLGKLEYFDSQGDGPAAQNRGTFDRDSFNFAVDNPGFYDTEILTGSLRADLDVDFGNGTITNIFGYRDYEGETDGDIDALPVFIFHSGTNLDQKQWSNELRYAGTFGNADVTTGVYYFDQEVGYDERRFIPPVTPAPFVGGGRQDHTVFGLFGQIDYAITDKLTGTVGLRYSEEKKTANVSLVVPRAALCSVINGTCPIDAINNDSVKFDNVTPKFGLQYTFSDTAQIYGSYTKGFRSGGYNFRITNPAGFLNLIATTGQLNFDEEKVDAFEAGAKLQTEDGRGQLNAAVFYTDISDMQREVNLPSATAGVSQSIVNTADADILGLELEGRFALTDNFLVMANLGLIDADYQDVRFDISGDAIVDATDLGLAIPRVPKATYGFGFIYDLDLAEAGSVTTRANFQHRDKFAYTDNNFGFINAVDMVSANITWNTPYEGVALSIYGKNLLDEVSAGGDTQLPFGTGAFSNGVNAPFDTSPAAGTFSPIKKGRLLGIELSIRG